MERTANTAAEQDELAHILEDNMGLVFLLAKSFNPRNENEFDEFVQLGRIGLWKAYKKHDPQRSVFSTTAWHFIRWEILRHLEKRSKESYELDENLIAGKSTEDSLWEYLPPTLSDIEKKVVELRLVDNRTFLNIGEVMGYSRGWANNIYRAALEKIKYANTN